MNDILLKPIRTFPEAVAFLKYCRGTHNRWCAWLESVNAPTDAANPSGRVGNSERHKCFSARYREIIVLLEE